MISVLMIAYGLPPEGNAGVYRSLRFVRHLPSFGWQPTIITLDTDAFERYDPSLLSQVPKEVEVIRVRNLDPWQGIPSETEPANTEATHQKKTLGCVVRITVTITQV